MTPSTAPSPVEEPYVGPKPFEERHSGIFCGRDNEARDLLSVVIAQREVIVFAKSGAGKTSLLNAGLLPLLKREGFTVLGPARVSAPTRENAPEDNIYVHNLQDSLAKSWVSTPRTGETLAAFLKKGIAADQASRGLKEPTLAILILDQFEELSQYYPERWHEREPFFVAICAALTENPLLRVVFSIREDHVADLTPFTPLLPERPYLFHLQQLDRGAAEAAVQVPLTRLPKEDQIEFTAEAVDKLVENLMMIQVRNAQGALERVPGEFVEPVQLQVVCLRLWSEARKEGLRRITEKELRQFGDVGQALSSYYEHCIHEVSHRRFHVKERDLRRWFGHTLITPDRTRATVYERDVHAQGMTRDVLRFLEEKHLLRREPRLGGYWYELTHDSFIEPIRLSNEEWLQKQGGDEATRIRLRRRAEAWLASGRSPGELLGEAELREVERWKSYDFYPELAELVIASREAHERRAQEAHQTQLSFSNELAMAAVSNLKMDPELSALLALQALAIFESPQALDALHQAVITCRIRMTHTAEHEMWGLTYSPDGKFLAAGAADGSAIVMDPASGYTLHKFQGHRGNVIGLAFSPDGKRLATAGFNGAAIVWDIARGQPALTLTGHAGSVVGVAYSPDGKLLATVGEDRTARIWAAASGKLLRTLTGHEQWVYSVAFSPDGKRLATASMDKTARIWSTDSFRLLRTLKGHEGPVYAAIFSPDGEQIATTSFDKTAKLWKVKSGKLAGTLSGHFGMLGMASFDPLGRLIATASADGKAKIWDIRSGRELLTIPGHKGVVYGASFSPDGKRLATSGWDKTVRVWDIRGGSELVGHTRSVNAISYSAGGKYLATASEDGATKLWDAASGEELKHLSHDAEPVLAVALSPSGRHATIASQNGMVKRWDTARGVGQVLHPGTFTAVTAAAFRPDGKRLAVANADGTAVICDVATGTRLATLSRHDAPVSGVAFHPDGRHLATAGADGRTKIWLLTEEKLLHTLQGHTSSITAVAYSPDGKILATSGVDGLAIIWDAVTGENRRELTGHVGAISALSFSSDGKRLATGGSGGTVKVWDVAEGKELVSRAGHEGPVNAIVFSPDGRRLATAGMDCSVRLNFLYDEDVKLLAKKRATRGLNPEECWRFLHGAPYSV
jgi:WD40 repeat protein